MVEKHFTLDINKKGFDHQISFDEKKFKQMTELIRLSFLTLGTEEKKLTLSEQKNKIKYRRYIVANENIKKGIKTSSIFKFLFKVFEASNFVTNKCDAQEKITLIENILVK